MTIRDHRNPYLFQRKKQDREQRAAARKNKRNRDFRNTRAELARELLQLINTN